MPCCPESPDNSETKERSTTALEAVGMSLSNAISLLMLRIADEKRLPAFRPAR
ncbi:MAG: hypothetical protein GVY11_08340 [Gammaproteobacteria bacterium]|nr:hypothetical protein [Gammaproteobacteria bacterium]